MGVDLCYKGWITKPFLKENGLVILKTKDNLRTVSEGCASCRAVYTHVEFGIVIVPTGTKWLRKFHMDIK